MTRPAVATLYRGRLLNNLARVRERAPGTAVYGIVKADAYGHGLAAVADALSGHVDGFGVACMEEAASLRKQGIDAPVLLLEGHAEASELESVAALGLDVALHCDEQAADLLALERRFTGRVWLKFDSGMHRLGFDESRARALWPVLLERFGPERVGLMSHLANADAPGDPLTAVQVGRFTKLADGLGARACSLCNSAAVLGEAARPGEWVRPGIMLYGISPLGGVSGEAIGLAPAMSFASALIAVRDVAAGEPVGYGGTWSAPHPARLGVVAAGYGDGYPRHARNGTPVLVRGQRVPLVGRVSMDMLTVDVSAVRGVERGERVVLWGDGLPVEDVAAASGTIAYELVCKLTARVRREVAA